MPLQAGLVFTILAAAYLAASVRAPALTQRFGRTLIGAGALTLAGGHLLLLIAVAATGASGSIAALVPGLILVGAGMGLCITPLTTVVLASARPESAGMVSGTLSTMQQIGNSVGVAVTGVIFFGAVASRLCPRVRVVGHGARSDAAGGRRPQPAAAPPGRAASRDTRGHDRSAHDRRLLPDDPSERQGPAPLPRRRPARTGRSGSFQRVPLLRGRPGAGRSGDPALP